MEVYDVTGIIPNENGICPQLTEILNHFEIVNSSELVDLSVVTAIEKEPVVDSSIGTDIEYESLVDSSVVTAIEDESIADSSVVTAIEDGSVIDSSIITAIEDESIVDSSVVTAIEDESFLNSSAVTAIEDEFVVDSSMVTAKAELVVDKQMRDITDEEEQKKSDKKLAIMLIVVLSLAFMTIKYDPKFNKRFPQVVKQLKTISHPGIIEGISGCPQVAVLSTCDKPITLTVQAVWDGSAKIVEVRTVTLKPGVQTVFSNPEVKSKKPLHLTLKFIDHPNNWCPLTIMDCQKKHF